MRKILIPFDGSAASMRAVEQVVALSGNMATPPGAILLAVVPPAGFGDQLLQGKPSDIRALQAPALENARKLMKQAAETLAKAGVTAQEHVEVGHPEEIINQFSDAYHCDLIVMGTRGLGPTAGLLMGSVATKTVHLTDLPVMLVK